MTLRVIIADDHTMLREGLAVLIAGQGDIEVVAQAGSGEEAVKMAHELRPDVCVLDISMPGMDGTEATARIVSECPGVRVVGLTRHADPAYVRRLMAAGASGYVLKKSAAQSLIAAIRKVAGGGTYVEPGLATASMQRSFGKLQAPESLEALSEREEEVLRAVAWGRSNKEIAAELGLSIKTVESYKANALEKLLLHSRADIVRYALGRGWLTADGAPE